MRKTLLQIFGFLLIAVEVSAATGRVGDFALIDHKGEFHQLSRYADHKAVVLLVHANSCASTLELTPEFLALADTYADQSIAFLMLNAMPDENRESIRLAAEHKGIDIPILVDQSQLVAESLGLSVAGEVLVINPARMELLYRGAMSREHSASARLDKDSLYLDEVLQALLSDQPVPVETIKARGIPIPMTALDASHERHISYVEDIAPILERRCVSCHREGGVAPWAMSSHQMVRGWSTMMRETLLTRRMPPGQIDPLDIDRFEDVHHITDQEMMTLIHWIDAGAVNDDDFDPLLSISPPESEWALGEPDMVIDFPAQEIPATGVIDYKFVPVEIDIDRRRWVQAYEFDIGDKSVLHHVVAYTQDEKQQKQNASRGGSRSNFGGYAPGREHMIFEEDTGVLLEPGMRFMIQFHYTTIGRQSTDRTRLGLYFSDKEPSRSLSRTAVMNGEFVIPPGVADYPVEAEAIIANDSYLYSFAPHMHYRGKRISFSAVFPDGRQEHLLGIPNFQHNWQMVYRLREPVFLPAGTRIEAKGGFDNSSLNPLNPDPGKEVRWGDQVWDEMFIAWMRISEDR
ncbi:MAG: redoxin domain-containing protein [Pseudomonadales bacterium]|nr:redoxin domain-containing protein [Pseudomonadales bacterium]